jgi:hypothetical protein
VKHVAVKFAFYRLTQTASIVCFILAAVSSLSSVSRAADAVETCPGLYEKLAKFTRKALRRPTPSSKSLKADVPLVGWFDLERLKHHHDVFEGVTDTGQKFIFRTDAARAKLEVSIYRFARAAGFNVPVTTYAEINGVSGSAQEMIIGQKLAADFTRENNWIELPWHKPDPATRVFDSILAMNDRNTSNYFITDDRRQILIDHEQAFFWNRRNNILRDGNDQILEIETVRAFIALDPVRAQNLADIANEANFLHALRDLSDQQRATFRERIKLYRRMYRRALETP